MPDLAQYDLIFFGHPIWWSEMPMVARTFLDKADLQWKEDRALLYAMKEAGSAAQNPT